jgi:hypothetical protein
MNARMTISSINQTIHHLPSQLTVAKQKVEGLEQKVRA